MAKSKSAKKKSQVSKHILKSREDAVTETGDNANANAINADMNSASVSASSKTSTTPSSSSSKKRKSKKNRHTKTPEEVSSYLTQWKASKSEDSSIRASSSWKFNKNTQSWLIRHMYEVDKVPKSSFFLLMDYLEGLEGSTIKDRMRSEASRRCRRHKEYCKNNPTTDNDDEKTEKGNNNDNENDDELPVVAEAEKPSTSKPTTSTTTTTTTSAEDKAELEYEEKLWKKMDDKEKRKQYKRARKILDLVN